MSYFIHNKLAFSLRSVHGNRRHHTHLSWIHPISLWYWYLIFYRSNFQCLRHCWRSCEVMPFNGPIGFLLLFHLCQLRSTSFRQKRWHLKQWTRSISNFSFSSQLPFDFPWTSVAESLLQLFLFGIHHSKFVDWSSIKYQLYEQVRKVYGEGPPR